MIGRFFRPMPAVWSVAGRGGSPGSHQGTDRLISSVLQARDDNDFVTLFPVRGVATLCWSVNRRESITRKISSKLRPVLAG